MVRFFTFSQYHGKRKGEGSARIRAGNLIKHWEEAELYKYGEKPDVLIFQKVYCTQDYKFPIHFEGKKILDICDPDWLDHYNVKETVDAVDAVVTPTEELAKFIRQMTDNPVRVIKDRFDIDEVPEPKTHEGKANTFVWFGYKHNAENIKFTIRYLERHKYKLIIISNEDPMAYRWAENQSYKDNVTFFKYNQETIYKDLQRADIALLPAGTRPVDRFKSNNKEIVSNLAGLPVAKKDVDVEKLIDPEYRKQVAQKSYTAALKDYDVKLSIAEYKDLINEL